MHTEKDSHALGDEILALGKLHHTAVPAFAAELLNRDDPIIRRLAVCAVEEEFRPAAGAPGVQLDAAARDTALGIAEAALLDLNLRVRREGITLISQLDASKAMDFAIATFADPGNKRATQAWPDWAAAIATHDAVFKEFIHRVPSGGDNLLLNVAALRSDPVLARAIESRLVELDAANPDKIPAAVICQADRSLSRRMFEVRSKLTPKTAAYVAHALEHAYDAQLGDVMGDWDQFLKRNGASANAAP